MKITELINEYIVSPYTADQRGRFAHYPSEASIISRIDGEIIGKCHRATWYDWMGDIPTNPINARGQWTFAAGKTIEGTYIEYLKQMGLWAGSNIKFYNRVHNISGEADIFIWLDRDKREKAGVEIKTAYGYGYQKSVTQFPKIENLLQVALYLDFFPVNEWHLIYKARDTQEDVEYVITMGEKKDTNGRFLCVDGQPCYIFYLQDIYDRYNILGEYVISKKIPPRDYTYGYTSEQSKQRFEMGRLSKSKWSNVQKYNITDSDWQCLYCSHLDRCWIDKRVAMKLKEGAADGETSDTKTTETIK